jgi:hypothetical protein
MHWLLPMIIIDVATNDQIVQMYGACGRVTGYWDVDFEELGCVTWWNRFSAQAHIHTAECCSSKLTGCYVQTR